MTTLVALTTQNRKSISGHAGMCRNFTLFTLDGSTVSGQRLVELTREQSFHELAEGAEHPLGAIDLLISGGMGSGLQQKLARRGIEALITTETDPLVAMQLLVQGSLPVIAAEAHEHTHEDGEHGHPHAHGEPAHAEGERCPGCRCGH